MAAELILTALAAEDIDEVYTWYEKRRMGLGEDFLNAATACIRSILENPQAHRKIEFGYRKTALRRFPYAAYFKHEGDTITIYAIMHASRDQNKWKRRILENEP